MDQQQHGPTPRTRKRAAASAAGETPQPAPTAMAPPLIATMGWHELSEEQYHAEAVERLHPELMGRVRFMFQWQEQKAPYALSPPIEMSEAFLSLGRAQWMAACHLWDRALNHNAFPGYSPHPHLACPPPWELSRWEERCVADPRIGEALFAGVSP